MTSRVRTANGIATVPVRYTMASKSSFICNFKIDLHGQFVKNLAFFVFVFSFAMLRLWITLLVPTYALKQSYMDT
jgi:hypothetical protein